MIGNFAFLICICKTHPWLASISSAGIWSCVVTKMWRNIGDFLWYKTMHYSFWRCTKDIFHSIAKHECPLLFFQNNHGWKMSEYPWHDTWQLQLSIERTKIVTRSVDSSHHTEMFSLASRLYLRKTHFGGIAFIIETPYAMAIWINIYPK